MNSNTIICPICGEQIEESDYPLLSDSFTTDTSGNRSEESIDKMAAPLVAFFNSNGLKTTMSCQGHNKTTMSMFWIGFDHSVTESDIVNFQQNHLDQCGGFAACGRFVRRVVVLKDGVRHSWEYMAATVEAAEEDLKRWQSDGG